MALDPIASLGPTGRTVASNIKRRRERQKLSYAELSRKIEANGRDIQPLALRRIEAGARRVDVDDLFAIAIALNTPPLDLLLPDSDRGQLPTGIGDDFVFLENADVRAWAQGHLPSLTATARHGYWAVMQESVGLRIEGLTNVLEKSLKELSAVDNAAMPFLQREIEKQQRELTVITARVERLASVTGMSFEEATLRGEVL